MFELQKPNKHNWCYRFVYWKNNTKRSNFYTIETNLGFKYAENLAWNSALWDGCMNMIYLGKNKMEVDNGTNA